MVLRFRAASLTGLILTTVFCLPMAAQTSQAGIPDVPKTATVTTLAVTAAGVPVASVVHGTVITLTATVITGTPGTGQVKFCNALAAYCTDINIIGSAQLTAAGTATYKFAPGIGQYKYQAVFVGTNTNASSASNIEPLAVTGMEPTATQLAATGVPGDYMLIANVYAFGGAVPSGNVSFYDTTNADYLFGIGELGPSESTLFNSSTPGLPGTVRGVALADINGDGIRDMLADSGNSIQALIGNGDGTFTQGSSAPTGLAPEYFAIGDFNSDGIIDVAAPNYFSNSVSILLGNGDGTFTVGQTIPNLGVYTYQVVAADFNGDGIQDLAVTDTANVTVYILLGNGDGTFQALAPFPIDTPGSTFGGYFAAADFNGDGKIDLAVSASDPQASQGQIVILLGNGDGTFAQQPISACPAFLSDSLAVGDFNGDGIPDLVAGAGNALALTSLNETVVLLGNGDGTFRTSETIPTGSSAPIAELTYSIAVGDFNGDGKADFAVTTIPADGSMAGSTVTLYLGEGNGAFDPSAQVDTGELPLQVAVADLNGDGLADLVTANFSSQNASVFLTANGATAAIDDISPVGTGIHYAQADYPGNVGTLPSNSNLVPLTAVREQTTLTLQISPATTAQNMPVTLSATLFPVTAQNHNAGGTVMFTLLPTSVVGQAQIQRNLATLTLTTLPVGNDCIQANYVGDTNFAPSVSNTICIVITPPPAIINFTASPNPVFVQNTVTLTAALSAPPGIGGTPAGTVTFEDGNTPIGTSTVNGNVATLTISTLSLGSHTLVATYNGSPQFGPSTATLAELVDDFTLTAQNTNVTINHGGKATYSLTLSDLYAATTVSAIGLTYKGAPDSSIVTFTPTSVAAGSPATAVTLTIQTPNYPVGPFNTADGATQNSPWNGGHESKGIALACLSLGAGMFVFGRKWRRWTGRLKCTASLVVLFAGTLLSGCGSGWKTQQYTIVITAVSGNLTHATTLTLTSECADGKTACPISH